LPASVQPDLAHPAIEPVCAWGKRTVISTKGARLSRLTSIGGEAGQG
jgi:hypothetical protein